MKLNRRQFLLLSAGVAAGCRAMGDGPKSAAAILQKVNAGSAGNYSQDGVYDHFRDLGFFIIRRDGQLFALSAICTHRKCKLKARPDHSFACPCHGSTFDAAGHVTGGPAKRDLPTLPSFTNAQDQLVVSVPAG